jgi:beta-lactamase class A
MPINFTRRQTLAMFAAPLFAGAFRRQGLTDRQESRLAELEARYGGRLGVAALDPASGRRIVHRGDDRFAMCSTFKFLAAALVLSRVDRGEERLDRRIVFSERDLVTYSPVTERRVSGQGMTVAELCEAAMTASDNTAGNLLLAGFGGPPALTAFARSLGDTITRLDRIETELNEATPGDPRDTTSPNAMADNLNRIVLGNVLAARSRDRLVEWLVACTTGAARLRAGFPAGWRVGDKTGSGNHGVTNDIAVAWPPDRKPLIVATYYAESSASATDRNTVLAAVARIIARA